MAGKPLHVALVHGWFPPLPVFGGIVRYLIDLREALTDLGHRVTIVTRAPESGSRSDPCILEADMRRLPRQFEFLSASLGYASALKRLNERDPVDVAEFTNYQAEGLAHAVRKMVPHVCRVVTTAQQARSFGVVRGSAVGRATRDSAERWAVRRSDLVVVPSQVHAREVQEEYGLADAPAVARLGLPDRFKIDHRVPTTATTFLYVGKLEPRKGFDVCIEAFAAVASERSDVRLSVVGEDPDAGEPAGFAERTLQKLSPDIRARTTVRGWVSDEELRDLYREADVLVAPSRYESFGLMAVEAMQARLAVIGTTGNGLEEIVVDGETGLTVGSGDRAALASALRTLCDSRIRLRMGEAGRQRYEQEFTSRAMAKASLSAYEMVIGRTPSRR